MKNSVDENQNLANQSTRTLRAAGETPDGQAGITLTEPQRRAQRANALSMIWAREAGVSVYIYQGEHDQRIIEIHGIVDQRETVLATATIERRLRDEFAQAVARLPLAELQTELRATQGLHNLKAEFWESAEKELDELRFTATALRHALEVVGCRGIHSTRRDKRECQCVVCVALANTQDGNTSVSDGATAQDGVEGSVASISPNNESNIEVKLSFCDTCFVPAFHELVDDKWECQGPAHSVITKNKNKNSG